MTHGESNTVKVTTELMHAAPQQSDFRWLLSSSRRFLTATVKVTPKIFAYCSLDELRSLLFHAAASSRPFLRTTATT